jgi:MFS superfamily sulfate permease-like transporter
MDWTDVSIKAIEALVPVVTIIVMYYWKEFVAATPKVLVPILAAAVGAALDYVTSLLTGGVYSPIWGAVLGALAVWLREIGSTFAQHGFRSYKS